MWPNVQCVFSMRRINEWKMHGFQLIIMRRKPCVYPNAWKTHLAHSAMYYIFIQFRFCVNLYTIRLNQYVPKHSNLVFIMVHTHYEFPRGKLLHLNGSTVVQLFDYAWTKITQWRLLAYWLLIWKAYRFKIIAVSLTAFTQANLLAVELIW